jgi:hypothetical protein
MTAYWIWFGPSVTREDIDRDLRNMHQAHIGGVTVLPVYPLAVDDPGKGVRNHPFLSPEFLSLLRHAARRARDLGMTVDVTLGTGWPYGGPWVTPGHGARMIRLRKGDAPLAEREKVLRRSGGALVVATPTGMRVKRPAVGGEGLVLNHYDRAALQRHLEAAGDKLAGAVGAGGVRAFWCDSLEVYDANWTEDFPAQFRRRRGYDLVPHLPLLFGEATPRSRQVRRDYWRTLSELAVDEFYGPVQRWCHDRGALLRAEPYGQPPVALAACRHIDLPVGEHYEWRMLNATRWTASGGHLFGKNLIDAEAWTWTGIPNRFADSLEDLKVASDMHFISGANSLMAVSYLCTPAGSDPAYWVSYWGPWMNERQPWWPYFPLLARYVQRVSWVLQQGTPVADVAMYLPIDDVFAATPADRGLNLYFDVRERLHGGPIPEFGLKSALAGDTPVVSTLLANGYNFDCIDSSTLPQARLDGNHITMGLGRYAVVVLPGLRGMPLADLEQLAAFVAAGGTLIATRRLPDVAYGNAQADTACLQKLVGEVFGPGRYGKGKALLARDERAAFRAALREALPPDLALEQPDADVAFVHRRLAREHLYFVANFSSRAKSLRASPPAPGRGVEVWDPMTGEMAARWDGRLHLDPFGSVVLRVRSGDPARPGPAALRELETVDLPGPWSFRALGFDAMTMARPRAWTEYDRWRNFSGKCTYETAFEVEPPKPGEHLVLDLGEVREVVEVVVNGKPGPVVWKRPYRAEVTPLLKPGRNVLQVHVTNLLINQVLGRPRPNYSAIHARFGQRFPDPAEWKECHPLASGLRGPVRLVRLREEPPRRP